jgi:Tfp pilus assembly protein PilF
MNTLEFRLMRAKSCQPAPRWHRRAAFSLLLLAVVVGLGYAVVVIGREVRAESYYRAAERELEQADHTQRRTHLEQAREHLARCLEIWPDSGRVHYLAAQAARRLGDSKEAAQHLRRAEQASWVEEAVDLERTLLRAQQGELPSVERPLMGLLQENRPENALVLETLAQAYLEAYQLPSAIDCLNRWLEMQPENTQALLWRAQAWFLVGRYEDARADYRRVVELDPDEGEAQLKLAELLLADRQADEALEHFSRLRERDPANARVLVGIAGCHCELGQPDQAVEILDEVLVHEPDNAAALAERGRLALEANQPKEAERWLRRAVAETPFERDRLYLLFRALKAQKRSTEAQEYMARVERIDADRGRLEQLKKSMLVSPHDVAVRCEIGAILVRNGQGQEGRRWLESALKENPGDGPSHAALADYFQQTGDPRLAAYHRRLAGP